MDGGHFLNVRYNAPICLIVLIINFCNRLLHWLTHLFSPKSYFRDHTLPDVLLSSASLLMPLPYGPPISCCPQPGLRACSMRLRCPHSQSVSSAKGWHAISLVTYFKTMAMAIQTPNGEQLSGQQSQAGVAKGCGDLICPLCLLLKLPAC